MNDVMSEIVCKNESVNLEDIPESEYLLSHETIAAIAELEEIYRAIWYRLYSEGYTIIEGVITPPVLKDTNVEYEIKNTTPTNS